MQKLILFLLLFACKLFADTYNANTIELQAKLFPKIALLSADINKQKPTLNIAIVAKPQEQAIAQKYKKAILQTYPKKLMHKQLKISINQFKNMKSQTDMIILLKHTPKELVKIVKWANTNRVLTFAAKPFYLKYGILASLSDDDKVKPYLNKTIIQKYNYNFNPYLLGISVVK